MHEILNLLCISLIRYADIQFAGLLQSLELSIHILPNVGNFLTQYIDTHFKYAR